MLEPGQLINIDLRGLSKPATLLVEKVARAFGKLYEPTHLRRITQAKTDAEIIEAKGNAQTMMIEERAIARLIAEETHKQKNIESITSRAIPHLRAESRPDAVDEDWIANFFDKCRIVSNDEMQELWGRILAGESNCPGRYSRRTVNSLASLDTSDAIIFTKLCQCSWTVGTRLPLVLDLNGSIYERLGVTFGDLTHLDSIGLITFHAPPQRFSLTSLPKHVMAIYIGVPIALKLALEKDNDFDVGHVLFTQTGGELASVTSPGRNDEFMRYVLEYWVNEMGLHVASPFPARDQTDGA